MFERRLVPRRPTHSKLLLLWVWSFCRSQDHSEAIQRILCGFVSTSPTAYLAHVTDVQILLLTASARAFQGAWHMSNECLCTCLCTSLCGTTQRTPAACEFDGRLIARQSSAILQTTPQWATQAATSAIYNIRYTPLPTTYPSK